jgi:hypothetical protein
MHARCVESTSGTKGFVFFFFVSKSLGTPGGGVALDTGCRVELPTMNADNSSSASKVPFFVSRIGHDYTAAPLEDSVDICPLIGKRKASQSANS